MLLKARSFGRIAALLFLALAVFGWGLQAKLELYKPVSVQKTLTAKLLTEKHLAKVLKALEQPDPTQPHSPVPALAFIFSFLLAVPLLQSLAQEAEIGLSHPGKLYLHGVYSLNLPPPSLS
jgi:hypothetical protein